MDLPVPPRPDALPSLPREAWPAHPNFPAQTLLLRSHEGFRSLSDQLLRDVPRAENLAQLGALYRYWKLAMRGHEAYEEGKLYPYLERRWRCSLDELRAGHETLAARHVEVLDAFAAIGFGGNPRPEDRERLVKALTAHHEVLLEHLRLEEDRVIPLLELTPDEFDDYYFNPITAPLGALDRDDGH